MRRKFATGTFISKEAWEDRWSVGGGARRLSTRLQAEKKRENAPYDFFDEELEADMKKTSDEEMNALLYEMDPDDPAQGPMYVGDEGNQGPEVEHVAPEAELRFNESYLAFCIDRDATKDEEKNYPFWGIRLAANMERMTWARMLTRGLRYQEDCESTIAWDRSILSPRKQKIIGNMMNIRAHSKAAALRLLENDPFHKKGLYKTVSLYRYPHSTLGEHNWGNRNVPYVALIMDEPAKQHSKEEKFLKRRHYHYLEINSRVSGYGPIFDVNTAWDDPDAKQLGSVLFFNAPDDDFAKDFVETDPYNLHGLYKSIFIARFNELDLNGRAQAKPKRAGHDPLRDRIIELGMGEPHDTAREPKWRPFSALTWLQRENDKRDREEYNEKRMKLYEERDDRIDLGVHHSEFEFRPGFYVYTGKRNETEWYDYWPHSFPPGEDGWGSSRLELEASVPPVDIFADDLE